MWVIFALHDPVRIQQLKLMRIRIRNPVFSCPVQRTGGERPWCQGQVFPDLFRPGGSHQREQHVATHGQGECHTRQYNCVEIIVLRTIRMPTLKGTVSRDRIQIFLTKMDSTRSKSEPLLVFLAFKMSRG